MSSSVVRFRYSGLERTVEPYVCGFDGQEQELVTAWQVAGESRSSPELGWRTYRVDMIDELEILPLSQCSPRPDFNRDDARYAGLYATRNVKSN